MEMRRLREMKGGGGQGFERETVEWDVHIAPTCSPFRDTIDKVTPIYTEIEKLMGSF